MKDLESSSILLDYFDVNGNAAITIAANGSVDVSDEFCVQKGQSVDIDVQVSLGTTDDVTLAIQMNGATVAAAQMQDNGANSDASSMSSFYRVTPSVDSDFQIVLTNNSANIQTVNIAY